MAHALDMRIEWEYMLVPVPKVATGDDLAKWVKNLNTLGSDGWEASVEVDANPGDVGPTIRQLLLKRPKKAEI